MDDIIYRQDAIDKLDKRFDSVPMELTAEILALRRDLRELPTAQPEIVYCKDCVKHNRSRGYLLDGTYVGIRDCCPLVEIRGKARAHEFDYQFCAYAERRTNGSD